MMSIDGLGPPSHIEAATGRALKESYANSSVHKKPFMRTPRGVILLITGMLVLGAIVGGAVGGTVGGNKNNNTPPPVVAPPPTPSATPVALSPTSQSQSLRPSTIPWPSGAGHGPVIFPTGSSR